MSKYSRRQFLHDSFVAAAAATAAGSVAPSLFAAEASQPSKGPNDKLGIAVCGVNDRGKAHLGGFQGNDRLNTEVVVICDADENVGKKRCEEVAARQNGRAPKFYQDIRQALEDKSVDCVSIAMPNHWHALASIWAMQAGKDVYVEKPVCHNVSEGRRMVEAARKYGRICQTGTQCRSNPGNFDMVDYIRSGKIGELKVARGLCYKGRPTIGPAGQYDVPSNIDYNLWCGPAPNPGKSPYEGRTKKTPVHYDWHWRSETGNGDLGNQGIHQMDVARWGLGVDTLPNGVICYGGRFGYEDAGDTANTQVVVLDYGPKSLVFEVRGLKTDRLHGAGVGNIFEGTDGYVVMTSYSGGKAYDKDWKEVRSFSGGASHFANFVQAVRSRKKEDLTADIEEGFLSSALCHLGNISYQLGTKLSSAETLDRLKGVKLADNAQETLNRTIEHLAANKVTIDGDAKFCCGEYLKFDPKSETFPGNAKANELLTREYRAPFVVPAAGQV